MAAVIMAALRGQRPNSPKLRSLSGPPAEGWAASLPLELVCKAVDQLDPLHDLDTIKSLTLTCRELKSYCRPIIFRTIEIGFDQSLELRLLLAKAEVKLPKPLETLRRLAILLKDSPDIADFVMVINLMWVPHQTADAQDEDKAQCCEAEALLSFVLDRPFPVVQDLTINVKAISFKDLSPGVQHSLLTLISTPKLAKLFIAMKSFPNTVLEQARHARFISICGTIYSDPLRPQLPSTIDPSITLPHALEMCHVPEESLPLLTKDHSPRFDSSRLSILRFGDSNIYSVGQDAIIRNSATSLVSLSLRVKDWESSLVLLPFGELVSLTNLELNVAMDQSRKLLYALSWLAASVGKRSANPKSMKMLGIGVILSLTLIPGLGIMDLDPAEAAMILQAHEALWAFAVSLNQTWPDLKGLNIHGGSEMIIGRTRRIQCLGSLSKAGHEGHGHN